MDRLVVKRDDDMRRRLADSLETATEGRQGARDVATLGRCADAPTSDETLSTSYACPDCGTSLAEITPRLFSFNSPLRRVPACSGLGRSRRWTPTGSSRTRRCRSARGDRALEAGSANWRLRQIEHLGEGARSSRLDVPWSKLPKDARA